MSTEFVSGLDHFRPKNNAVVTVGTFDGIHRGHQSIFSRVRSVAESKGLNPVLITFHPHPRVVLTPNSVPMLLTSLEEKKQFLPDYFDGQVLILEFTKALKEMTAEEFTTKILIEAIHTQHLVIGYDHALGRDRTGNADELRRLGKAGGFEVEVVDPVMLKDEPVSSSRIRQSLTAGSLEETTELLGHEYAILGTVERGIGLGRKLGYPTANISYSPRKLLPPEGIYACWAEVDGESFQGMMFVGQNHFNPECRITVEANLFNFDRDIYNQQITVYPIKFIRESRRFANTDELIIRLGQDKEEVMEIMNKGEKACQ